MLIGNAPRSLDAQDCTFSRFSRFCTPMPDGATVREGGGRTVSQCCHGQARRESAGWQAGKRPSNAGWRLRRPVGSLLKATQLLGQRVPHACRAGYRGGNNGRLLFRDGESLFFLQCTTPGPFCSFCSARRFSRGRPHYEPTRARHHTTHHARRHVASETHM